MSGCSWSLLTCEAHWSLKKKEEERRGQWWERTECSLVWGLVLSLDPGTNGVFIGEIVLSLRGRKTFCSDSLGLFHVCEAGYFSPIRSSHSPAMFTLENVRLWELVCALGGSWDLKWGVLGLQCSFAFPGRVLWRIYPSACPQAPLGVILPCKICGVFEELTSMRLI